MSVQLEILPSMVDVAAVAVNTTSTDVAAACSIARAYGCASVIVNPCFLAAAAKLLRLDEGVLRGATCSFPFGCELTAVKLYAAQQSVLLGAEELDIVMNVEAFLSGNIELAKREISLVRGTIEVPLKVIIEAPLLSDAQIAEASELIADTGVNWIETGTGLNGPATAAQVSIIRETAAGRAKIKAAGGIHTVEDMISLCEAGATRFGISAPDALTLFGEIDRKLGRRSPEIQQ